MAHNVHRAFGSKAMETPCWSKDRSRRLRLVLVLKPLLSGNRKTKTQYERATVGRSRSRSRKP